MDQGYHKLCCKHMHALSHRRHVAHNPRACCRHMLASSTSQQPGCITNNSLQQQWM